MKHLACHIWYLPTPNGLDITPPKACPSGIARPSCANNILCPSVKVPPRQTRKRPAGQTGGHRHVHQFANTIYCTPFNEPRCSCTAAATTLDSRTMATSLPILVVCVLTVILLSFIVTDSLLLMSDWRRSLWIGGRTDFGSEWSPRPYRRQIARVPRSISWQRHSGQFRRPHACIIAAHH